MTNAEDLVARHPEYAERFDAIKEGIPRQEAIKETYGKNPPFKSVASLCLPVDRAYWLVNGSITSDKKKFYAWLDQNRQYCTYDRTKALAETNRPHTYVNGKAI